MHAALKPVGLSPLPRQPSLDNDSVGGIGGLVWSGDPSVSGPCVTLPHVCQGSSRSDSFCQALIANRRKEEGDASRRDTLENRAGGGATAPALCKQVNRLIHFSA